MDDAQDKLCLSGFIPIMQKLSTAENDKIVRREVAYFYGIACKNHRKSKSLSYIMAAGSLTSILEFFDIEYDQHKSLTMLGIDVILSLKESDIFQNDEELIQILTHYGLLH